jgi:hypothetical protein
MQQNELIVVLAVVLLLLFLALRQIARPFVCGRDSALRMMNSFERSLYGFTDISP